MTRSVNGVGRGGEGRKPRIVGAAGVAMLAALAGIAAALGAPNGLVGALVGAVFALPIGGAVGASGVRRRWGALTRRLRAQVASRADGSIEAITIGPELASNPPMADLARVIAATLDHRAEAETPSRPVVASDSQSPMTLSGLFAPNAGSGDDLSYSASFGNDEMVGRLEPVSLRWIEASPRLQQFLGAELDRLRGRSILEFLEQPADRPTAARRLGEVADRGEALGLIYRVLTLEGVRKAVELNVSARYSADLTVAYLRCHLTDVTDRLNARREQRRKTRELLRLNDELRRANAELVTAQNRYSDLYQNAPAMYFSLDFQGRILVCNRTMLRTLGYERVELQGRHYDVLIPEEHRPSARARFDRFLQDGRVMAESRWMTTDGRVLDVLVTGTVVRDPEGRMHHCRSVAQDITDRKRLEAELLRNNQRLARINDELSRKNRELDEFTYAISHDLQEPVRTLIAFSGFLRDDCADRLNARGLEYLRFLTDASTRMRALIRDLLDLSRAGRDAAEFGPVPLASVLETTRADHAELIRTKGGEVVPLGDLPTLWGDRDRIARLLGNLISNGLKYNESASPRVEVLARPEAGSNRDTVMVRDNGIGIDERHHDKVFQMFRRLHPRERYEGTGAGLAICQKIAQVHGGRIWVESQPGAGSTFCVSLPLAPADRSGPSPPQSARAIPPSTDRFAPNRAPSDEAAHAR